MKSDTGIQRNVMDQPNREPDLYATEPRVAVRNAIEKDIAYFTQEIQIALGIINLSAELLESIIEDIDLKMYLDVIKRNSNRINIQINKFLESH